MKDRLKMVLNLNFTDTLKYHNRLLFKFVYNDLLYFYSHL